MECPDCGRSYEDRWRCVCGEPLSFGERPRPDIDPEEIDPGEGLWAFSGFLPIEKRVSLGEGFTPLVDAPGWDVSFKLEYVFPTGSFKDRGATTTLSRAVGVGADRIVEDSSGNAGIAIATYAARAGIDAEIYVPADTAKLKLRAIRRTGAEVVPIEGSREAVTGACIERVEEGDVWYGSHAWNPAFLAGTSTMAHEIAFQRGWSVPDAVVVPLGHGTMFLGAYRGFRALEAAGWIDRTPRILGAQAAGYAPIVAEIHGETAAAGDNDVADGIRIREPVRRREILAAIDETDGDAIALSKDAVDRELDCLHRAGFYTAATSAVAPAALRAYRERGVLSADEDVVVALSGSGSTGCHRRARPRNPAATAPR